jgi:hypothetical protein
MTTNHTDNIIRIMPIFRQSGMNESGRPTFEEYRVALTYHEAYRLSTYWNEVRNNVPRGYPIEGELKENPYITDIHGVQHELIIDSPRIRKFTNSKSSSHTQRYPLGRSLTKHLEREHYGRKGYHHDGDSWYKPAN